jgi:hypothetical protein
VTTSVQASADRSRALRDNDIDLESNKLGGDFSEAPGASFTIPIFDCDGATLDPPEFTQSLHKSGNPLTMG